MHCATYQNGSGYSFSPANSHACQSNGHACTPRALPECGANSTVSTDGAHRMTAGLLGRNNPERPLARYVERGWKIADRQIDLRVAGATAANNSIVIIKNDYSFEDIVVNVAN